MESGWNVWVWLVGVVSRRRVWLVGVGGIYGCGCKEVYIFPHTTYPYSSLGTRTLCGNFFRNTVDREIFVVTIFS